MMPDATNPLPSAENDVCDGCQKRPCVCETVVLPTVEKDVPVCRCDCAYVGAQLAGTPIRCERCGGLVDEVAAARMEAVYAESRRRLEERAATRVFPPDVPADDDQLALDHQRPTPVCPECAQGKCPNCTGMALDGDDFVACTCTHGK